MRRLVRLTVVLLLGFGAAASAAVVERLSPSLELGSSPAPAFFPTLSGPVSASFSPALTGVIAAPSLSAPSPVLLPAFAAPVAALNTVAAPVPALAAQPPSAPAAPSRERGPPTARDADFSAVVAKSVADKSREWAVPTADIFSTHDAILVGENHQSLASVSELTRALGRLAREGVKVLGIEGLKRPDQAAVDAFVAGESDELPVDALSFSPKRRAVFSDLLRAARTSGVRVVALGLPLEGWARQAAALAAARTDEPPESFGLNAGDQLYRAQIGYEPGYNESVAEVYLSRRNESMAGFLHEAAVAGAKAVVLVGQSHIEGPDDSAGLLLRAPGDWGSLGRELARRGLRAFSLTLTGGLYTDAESSVNDLGARPAAHRLAAAAAPNGAPAWKPTGPSTGLWHAGGRVPKYALVAH